MHRKTITIAMTGVAALALAAGSAEAQGRRDSQGIPPGHLPPAGTCRIWYDNVPPGRQPAPTSCADAERRVPRGARVIYGTSRNGRDDGRYDGRRDDGRYDGRRDDGRYDGRRDDGRYDGRRDDGRYDGRYEERQGRSRADDRTGRTRTGGAGSSARSGEWCLDRNRDGRCDDVYRDGRAGSNARYPSRLPQMPSVRLLERGDWRATGSDWGLDDRSLRVRYTDANRDGRPEDVTWIDARNRVVQRWIDHDRDGRADRVTIYENGRVVRTIQ